MARQGSRQIIIAGGGIAGLTAALAFARHGFSVQLCERASSFDQVGAGLQLSPNAVRLLGELGVTDGLIGAAVRPDHVTLRDARSLAVLARVRLGDFAEQRWGAPYLVAHRADLHSALAARARREPEIRILTSAAVRDFALHGDGVTASIDHGGKVAEATGRLLVAADGVWSSLRALAGTEGQSRFSGRIAWRAAIRADGEAGSIVAGMVEQNSVTAFLHRSSHMIVYPLRGGETVNLVVVTAGEARGESWSGPADPKRLAEAVRGASTQIVALIDRVANWTVWPIHTVAFEREWTLGGAFALIGDAAHAMTPFAAQGAAMAIEDAATLAAALAAAPEDATPALAAWEALRRPRIERVIRRGALNRFAWHASGPVALARNLFLKTRSPERLAADLDWLYGWRMPAPDKR
jgi:salicylate hydroxylase